MKHRFLAMFLAAAGAVYGADREFDHIVKAIENHYAVKRTNIPLMGLANLFVKVAHPAGTTGFRLAIFEDLPARADSDPIELDRFIGDVCRDGMHALVVTHSRRNGESTYILTGEVGKSTKVLVATFERTEATVVEVTADFDALLQMINSPDTARMIGRSDRGERPDW